MQGYMIAKIDRMLDVGNSDTEILEAVCEEYAPYHQMPEFAQGYADYSHRKHQNFERGCAAGI
jgi:hypothetical protein